MISRPMCLPRSCWHGVCLWLGGETKTFFAFTSFIAVWIFILQFNWGNFTCRQWPSVGTFEVCCSHCVTLDVVNIRQCSMSMTAMDCPCSLCIHVYIL